MSQPDSISSRQTAPRSDAGALSPPHHVQIGKVKIALSSAQNPLTPPLMRTDSRGVRKSRSLSPRQHRASLEPRVNADQARQHARSRGVASKEPILSLSERMQVAGADFQKELLWTLRTQLDEIRSQKIVKASALKEHKHEAGSAAQPHHHHEEPVVTMEELESAYRYFLDEDAAVRPGTPLENLTRLFAQLPPAQAHQDLFFDSLERFTLQMLNLAYEQHLHNPEHFVSHGFDHSMNVAGYTRAMLGAPIAGEPTAEEVAHSASEVGDPRLVASTMDKYKISQGQARFALELVALLHDCGYPCLHNRTKCVHGISGADLVYRMGGDFAALITGDEADKQALFRDLCLSIMYHSADRQDVAYDAKVETTMGSFLIDPKQVYGVLCSFYDKTKNEAQTPRLATKITVQSSQQAQELIEQLHLAQAYAIERCGLSPDEASLPQVVVKEHPEKFMGRVADLDTPGDKLIGLEFSETDLLQTPLNIVRLADNMDMSFSRMTPTQRHPIFRELYHRLGASGASYPETPISFELERLEREHAKVKMQTPSEAARVHQSALAVLRSAKDRKLLPSLEDIGFERLSDVKKVREQFNRALIERLLDQSDEHVALATQARLIEVGRHLSSYDLRHFGGCEAIQGVDLVIKQGIAMLVVRVDKELYHRLNETQVQESSMVGQEKLTLNVGVGEYQVWRALEAFRSIKIAGSPMRVLVRDAADEQGYIELPFTQ